VTDGKGVAQLGRAGDKGDAGLVRKIEQLRQRIVVGKRALSLPHQKSAERGITLAETSEITVDAAAIVIKVRKRIHRPEIELDIGLDLSIGARAARIQKNARQLAREVPGRAARVREADRVAGRHPV